MRERVRAAVAAGLVLLLGSGAVAGCTGGGPATPDRLVIAAGGQVYRVLAEALAEAARRAWGAEVRVTGQDGSVNNLRQVAEGEADVGFATLDTASIAVSGNRPFARAQPIRALARLYDDYLQLVTLAGGPVGGLDDLAGRQVAVGSRNSGTDIAADRVLAAADVDPDRVEAGAGTAASALRRGELDAFFVTGGLPTPAVTGLAEQVAVRLLPLQQLVPVLQAQHGESYQVRSVPAGTYPGIDATVQTVGIPNLLVVREDLPDDTAYRLTELLFGAKPELVAAHPEARGLDQRSALGSSPIPLHPGAARYYQDAKPLAAR